MNIGWGDHGRGDPRHFVNYCLQPRDSKGVARVDVKILRGDPEIFAAVAGPLDFKTRFRAGYIGFSPSERPSDEELDAIIRDLEKNVLFPGFSDSERATR